MKDRFSVVIESGVPVPGKVRGKRSSMFDVCDGMNVGDSFEIANVKHRVILFSAWARKRGWKAQSRTSQDGKSIRIWRVK